MTNPFVFWPIVAIVTALVIWLWMPKSSTPKKPGHAHHSGGHHNELNWPGWLALIAVLGGCVALYLAKQNNKDWPLYIGGVTFALPLLYLWITGKEANKVGWLYAVIVPIIGIFFISNFKAQKAGEKEKKVDVMVATKDYNYPQILARQREMNRDLRHWKASFIPETHYDEWVSQQTVIEDWGFYRSTLTFSIPLEYGETLTVRVQNDTGGFRATGTWKWVSANGARTLHSGTASIATSVPDPSMGPEVSVTLNNLPCRKGTPTIVGVLRPECDLKTYLARWVP